MELNFYICHKEVVNCGYLCIGPSGSHPSPLGWEMRDASSRGQAQSYVEWKDGVDRRSTLLSDPTEDCG